MARDDRGEAGAVQCVQCRHVAAVHFDVAFADDGEGDLCQLEEVAAGADATDGAHNRVDAVVQHASEDIDSTAGSAPE